MKKNGDWPDAPCDACLDADWTSCGAGTYEPRNAEKLARGEDPGSIPGSNSCRQRPLNCARCAPSMPAAPSSEIWTCVNVVASRHLHIRNGRRHRRHRKGAHNNPEQGNVRSVCQGKRTVCQRCHVGHHRQEMLRRVQHDGYVPNTRTCATRWPPLTRARLQLN